MTIVLSEDTMSYLMDQLLADQQRLRGEVKPLAAGCGQQGRYPTRPEPAEACTDLGADDGIPPEYGPRIGVGLLLLSAALTVGCAAVVIRFAY